MHFPRVPKEMTVQPISFLHPQEKEMDLVLGLIWNSNTDSQMSLHCALLYCNRSYLWLGVDVSAFVGLLPR